MGKACSGDAPDSRLVDSFLEGLKSMKTVALKLSPLVGCWKHL